MTKMVKQWFASDVTPEEAQLLARNFRAASVSRSVAPQIRSGGMHDMTKIVDLLQAHDVPVNRFEVVRPRDVARDESRTAQVEISAPKLPERAEHYMFSQPFSHRPEMVLYRFEDVYLSFDITHDARRQFYLFDHDKRLINGLFFGAQPFLDPEMGTIERPSVLIDDFFVKPNICHFLFDKMPRVAIAEPEFGQREALMFHDFGYAREVLGIVDIPMTALAAKAKRGTVRLKDVVVYANSFNRLGHPGMVGGPNHIAGLEILRQRIFDLAGPAGPDAPQRYMLDRAPGLPRNITNRDEVARLLIARGVTLGDPAILSPREQLMLFAHVDLLIGVHGAGLTNLAYQPRGARVIELLPPLCATRAYWIMANALGQSYGAITCHDPELGVVDSTGLRHDGSQNRRDVVVPLDQLEAALDG